MLFLVASRSSLSHFTAAFLELDSVLAVSVRKCVTASMTYKVVTSLLNGLNRSTQSTREASEFCVRAVVAKAIAR